MNAGRYALSQILDLVHWQTLSRLVAKYEPKTVVRHFGFRQQFICMVFAQLTSRDGLRDIATCLNARPETLYDLGFTEKVARSTLAEANESRDWRIWEDLAKSLIRKARPLYAGEDLGVELDNTIYALDSTTIDWSLTLFPWADSRQTKSGIKMHTQIDLRGPIPTCIHVTGAREHDVGWLDHLCGRCLADAQSWIDAAALFKERLIPLMKRICLIALLPLLVVLPAAAAPKHLFILSGQSNMERLNPEVSFTPTVAEAFGKENVTVVKDAQGGKPIRSWCSETNGKIEIGGLYKSLLGKVQALGDLSQYESVTFVWMQGERDATEKLGEVYAANLKGLIKRLSTDLKRDDLFFVIGRLSDFDMANKSYAHWTMIRDVQVAVAEEDKRGGWVNTDDLNDKGSPPKNDLHYTNEGYKLFGKRLADKAIELIKSKGR